MTARKQPRKSRPTLAYANDGAVARTPSSGEKPHPAVLALARLLAAQAVEEHFRALASEER